MGTEDLSVLVHGPIVLAGLWGGPEPRGSMRFCRWGEAGGRKNEVLCRSKSFARINWATFLKILHFIP